MKNERCDTDHPARVCVVGSRGGGGGGGGGAVVVAGGRNQSRQHRRLSRAYATR